MRVEVISNEIKLFSSNMCKAIKLNTCMDLIDHSDTYADNSIYLAANAIKDLKFDTSMKWFYNILPFITFKELRYYLMFLVKVRIYFS